MVVWKVVWKDSCLAVQLVGMTVAWTVDASVDWWEVAMVELRVVKWVL